MVVTKGATGHCFNTFKTGKGKKLQRNDENSRNRTSKQPEARENATDHCDWCWFVSD